MADTSPPALETIGKPGHPHASRDMLPHVEMPAMGAGAAGIKLFGKLITTQQQQQHMQHAGAGGAAGSAPPRLHHQQQAAAPGRGSSADLLEEAARARAAAAEARLPCPRCRSRDTKFCYFNNYNVNQPRHFCRACHRYWTAGGAIRNVPVGSGRRKNRPALPPHAAAASAGHVVSAGSGSPPVFSTPGFAVPGHGSPAFHLAPSPAYSAAGLPEAAGQCWWLVASAAHPVASDRAF